MNQSYTIEIDPECEHPARLVKEFYETNGYQIVEEPDHPLLLQRGKAGAGWWTSNMTKLWCQVTVEPQPQTLVLAYEVDTSGQILSDDDRAFFEREVEALRSFLDEPNGPIDLRDQEQHRAQSVTGEYRRLALKATVLVFLLVSIIGLVAAQFGYL